MKQNLSIKIKLICSLGALLMFLMYQNFTSPGINLLNGYYRNNGGGLIYANGKKVFCYFKTFQAYLNSGGRPDAEKLPAISDSEYSNLSNGGPCSVADRIARFEQLLNDVDVNVKNKDIIKVSIVSDKVRRVFLHAEGRIIPFSGKAVAMLRLVQNNQNVGSTSMIDWSSSYDNALAQHMFNLIGVVKLQPGLNSISLSAINLKDGVSYRIGGGASLAVLETSAEKIQIQELTADSSAFQDKIIPRFLKANKDEMKVMIEKVIKAEKEVINNPKALSVFNESYVTENAQKFLQLKDKLKKSAAILMSGSFFYSGRPIGDDGLRSGYGDAAAGISFSNSSKLKCPDSKKASWAVNDLWPGAETTSPVFAHGLYQEGQPDNLVSAIGVPFRWPYWALSVHPNASKFSIGAKTALISIENPKILSKELSSFEQSCNQNLTVCIGSDSNFSGCGKLNNVVSLKSTQIMIPQGHDGIVMFVAKTRVAGGDNDRGDRGFAHLAILIDGKKVGTEGIQELTLGHADSQRTISASYLSTSQNRLSEGMHTVEVVGWGEGRFSHLMYFQDLPLLYFD